VAIAVEAAVRSGRRVAYLDLDAHHGDGVMYGFYGSGRVLDIDFHQDGRTLFPGTGFANETGTADGAGLKVNLPLPPLAGDEALLPLFRRVAVPMLEEFRPDLLVVQHGVDGHVGDPLARLQYTPWAYREIDLAVLELSERVAHGRILVTGGGGYRAEAVSRVLATTGAILAGLPAASRERSPSARWREEFARRFDMPAPAGWEAEATRVRSPWSPDDEQELVHRLEAGLGRKFPAPASG
jgi:acetoin utilization protein AcuC